MKSKTVSKPPQYLRGVIAHLVAGAAILITTLILIPLKPYLGIQQIALLYLLPIMVSTVMGGLTPGIMAGVLAFFTFNYYFIEPYFTLRVHTTQDLITLIIFLMVGIVMSQLIGQAREGIRLARIREWEAVHMYQLISAFAGIQDLRKIVTVLADDILKTFPVEFVQISIQNDDKTEKNITVTQPTDLIPNANPNITLSMETNRGIEGEISLWHSHSQFTQEQDRLIHAYANQAALALERTRLVQSENKARLLEESDQLKTSLLNSVSHELRSPLAVIKASVSSLRSGAVDWNPEAQQDLLSSIEEETDHLNLLVGNLLDMSRIEAGALQLQRRWNSILEIVQGTLSKMKPQLVGHQILLEFSEPLALVPTDYTLIEQVFINLLSNSAKYAPSGTEIRITGFQENDLFHVQVINHSSPVPEEHLEQIFDKFHRVTDSDRITGTGLGLSICKGIIEAHGGKIWAENGRDCFLFHFTLPLAMDGALPDIPKEEGDGERSTHPAD